ncbi:TY-Chap domain-containing protein [Streptomyces sp. NPDC087440]|uniref:TY-Chap domain-containing protein n=1 Tax=Streptomyces sp. NPDC087440 TaxID=3365790 RepID=UPI003822B90D
MESTVWDALLGHGEVPLVARYLGDEYVQDRDRLRIGAPEDSVAVTLTRCGEHHVVAEVWPPEGMSLTAVQERALRELGWKNRDTGVSPARPTWCLEWRWYADIPTQHGRAVVAALRDVLEVPTERVTVRGWGVDGPFRVHGLERFDDRPSARGVTGPCTAWADLRARLDWVLGTLPTDAAVVMSGPQGSVVQFMTTVNGTVLTGASGAELDVANLPTPDDPGSEQSRRMLADGWLPEVMGPGFAEWTLGEPVVHSGAGPLARKAVAALQTLGAERPDEVTVTVFRNGSRPDPAYAVEELGLSPT